MRLLLRDLGEPRFFGTCTRCPWGGAASQVVATACPEPPPPDVRNQRARQLPADFCALVTMSRAFTGCRLDPMAHTVDPFEPLNRLPRTLSMNGT